jgi:peptidoglycan hydrolase CwlO-like protein
MFLSNTFFASYPSETSPSSVIDYDFQNFNFSSDDEDSLDSLVDDFGSLRPDELDSLDKFILTSEMDKVKRFQKSDLSNLEKTQKKLQKMKRELKRSLEAAEENDEDCEDLKEQLENLSVSIKKVKATIKELKK